jgi:diguanylate cyclase (GGDEF)-like protein
VTTEPTDVASLTRRLRRERAARFEAEAIAERVTRQMYEAAQQLVASQAVLDETADFVAITDASGVISYANRAFYELVAATPSDDETLNLLSYLDTASQARFQNDTLPTLEGKGLWRGELVLAGPDGVAVPVSQVVVAHTRSDGVIERLSFVARDITEQRALHDQLTRDAQHDALTGLANRRLFYNELERALSREEAHPVVLFVDLDGFKQVNDTFGHEAGDAILTAVANRLRSHVREHEVVARMGGDEFAILCPDLADGQAGLELAERLTAAVGEPIRVRGLTEPLFIGMSTGVAVAPGRDVSVEDIIRHADVAMYTAKRTNRGSAQLLPLAIPAPRQR